MAQSTKTPAMILQEYTVKKQVKPPEYNLIFSKIGTHDNEFRYSVSVDGVIANGFGRSKQVAKHEAAQNALEMLADSGNLIRVFGDSSEAERTFIPKLHRNETDSPHQAPVNYVGKLKDLCAENKISYPIFSELSDVGPPHARQFTWKCKVASIVTQETANTKKQAKQICAKSMLERIADIIPELAQAEIQQKNALTENESVIVRYTELTIFPEVILNKSLNIGDYNLCLRKLMDEKNVRAEDLKEIFTKRCLEDMKELLTKLELTYKITKIQDAPFIVIFSVSFEVPFACMGMSFDSEEQATTSAIEETFKTLEAYMELDA